MAYNQNGRVASFIAVNNGTVEGCAANVQFRTKTDGAGFVFENQGAIKNSVSVRCVKGKRGKGFYYRNTGNISVSAYLAGECAKRTDCGFVLTFLTDEQVSASIFIPDNERFNVLIRVSTGDYLSTVQNDGYRVAVCSILESIAHELTHYYQWVKDHDCRFNEAQARAKAVRIVSKYWDMRQTPCSFAN